MSLWNKILVALIGVAAVPLLFLAMWTLKVHQYWAELANRHDKRIEQLQRENSLLADGVDLEGNPGQDGIRQVRLELSKLLLDRRRAWFHCDPKVIKTGDGSAEITVSIDQPAPHGIAPKTVLYAFEETDTKNKGQYLGEFIVSAAKDGDKQITLAPASKPLGKRETERLDKLARAKTKGPWVLYEVLPRDNRELLASLDEAQKKALLPADVLSEYLKDGKPAAKDDLKERVQDGKYVRPLRDYGVLLGAEHRKHVLVSDSIEIAKRDKQLLEEALTAARKQEDACKKDVAAATEQKMELDRQCDAVADYHSKLKDKLAAMQALTAQLIKTNQAMAALIAKYQLQAAERIDARTRAMAQSATERH